ncbi:MAG: hypothetical protein ABJQ90_00020 [Parasphingorhabdus sp.]
MFRLKSSHGHSSALELDDWIPASVLRDFIQIHHSQKRFRLKLCSVSSSSLTLGDRIAVELGSETSLANIGG